MALIPWREIFPVIIKDQEFLDEVQRGKVTFVGSSLLAEFEITHWMTEEGVRSEYRVNRVISGTMRRTNVPGGNFHTMPELQRLMETGGIQFMCARDFAVHQHGPPTS